MSVMMCCKPTLARLASAKALGWYSWAGDSNPGQSWLVSACGGCGGGGGGLLIPNAGAGGGGGGGGVPANPAASSDPRAGAEV